MYILDLFHDFQLQLKIFLFLLRIAIPQQHCAVLTCRTLANLLQHSVTRSFTPWRNRDCTHRNVAHIHVLLKNSKLLARNRSSTIFWTNRGGKYWKATSSNSSISYDKSSLSMVALRKDEKDRETEWHGAPETKKNRNGVIDGNKEMYSDPKGREIQRSELIEEMHKEMGMNGKWRNEQKKF